MGYINHKNKKANIDTTDTSFDEGQEEDVGGVYLPGDRGMIPEEDHKRIIRKKQKLWLLIRF